MRNRRRNMMSALAATVLMSSVSVMRTMRRQEAGQARSRRTISGGADRDEGDEDENQCGEADHEEVGAGDVLLRIPRFLARLCDDLVAFEDDEREAHRAEQGEELRARGVPAEERLEVLRREPR